MKKKKLIVDLVGVLNRCMFIAGQGIDCRTRLSYVMYDSVEQQQLINKSCVYVFFFFSFFLALLLYWWSSSIIMDISLRKRTAFYFLVILFGCCSTDTISLDIVWTWTNNTSLSIFNWNQKSMSFICDIIFNKQIQMMRILLRERLSIIRPNESYFRRFKSISRLSSRF